MVSAALQHKKRDQQPEKAFEGKQNESNDSKSPYMTFQIPSFHPNSPVVE